jgi:hypothetical protein
MFFSAFLLILRSTQFYFLLPFKTEHRELVPISNVTWGILGLFQLGGVCIIFGFNTAKGIAAGSGMVDTVIFIGQFILHKMHAKAAAGGT